MPTNIKNRPERMAVPPMALKPALFLDFDGTLVAFADEPDGVTVSRSLTALLERLHAAIDGALAMVTGRGLDNLAMHLGHESFAAAGAHGAEWRLPGMAVETTKGAPFSKIIEAAQTFASAHEGVRLEEKSGGVTLHYRQRPDLRAESKQTLKAALAGHGDFELLRGNMMWEVRRKGVNKGTAIRKLMQHPPFKGRMPVFIGDDVTDEDGFAEANRQGGMAIKVGTGESCAGYRLAGIEDVHRWLEGLAAFNEENRP